MITGIAFYASVAFHLVAALLFLSRRRGWALFFLLIGGVVMRYYFTGLDPFLHDWDERFHALVAKNMTQHWLMPTLIDHPLLPYTQKWNETHIWLHKQPLFLWQMAVSISLFGANEFAVRLPSLIMTSILILVIYQMGKALFDTNTAFVAAFIFSCYEPLLEMNSGMKGMDHDDVAFIFYVMLSLWAWIYFEKTTSRRYLLLMGFFSGCAILCKWLTGLLVFSGFAFYHLFLVRDLFTWATIRDIAIALAVCLLTFMPWQIYIYMHYPVIAHYENAYNTKHLYKVVEGHEHETWYYFNLLGKYYKGLEILILIGMGYCLFYARRYALAMAIAFMWVLVYVFFTVARTKVESYVMLVAPLGLLFIAASVGFLMDGLLKSDRWRYLAGSICFIGLFLIFTDVRSISAAHFTADNWEGWTRKYKLQRAEVFRKLAVRMAKDAVLINLENQDDIDAMFYTGHTCYEQRSRSDYELLKKLNCPIVYWGDTLPDYAQNDSATILAKDLLK